MLHRAAERGLFPFRRWRPRRYSFPGGWRLTAFPRVTDPRVSIVVNAEDCLGSALRCLHALSRCSGAIPCEVILFLGSPHPPNASP